MSDQLHQHVQQVLEAIENAARALDATDLVLVVCGLAQHYAGQKAASDVGDVDILLREPLAPRFWEFAEELARSGLHPVYNLIDPPTEFPWNPCYRMEYAHGIAWTIHGPGSHSSSVWDPEARREARHGNLDIKLSRKELEAVPGSGNWVNLLQQWQKGNDALVEKDHQKLLGECWPEEETKAAFNEAAYNKVRPILRFNPSCWRKKY